MTDLNKAELRRLAESASPAIEWYAPGDLRYADDKTGEVHGLNHDDDSFISAANPAAILSLLDEHLAANAEIERLRAKLMAISNEASSIARRYASGSTERMRLEHLSSMAREGDANG